ncbi:MAG: hypothetical protein AAGB29_02885 [Planctomycetota bacterium]
MAQLWLTVDAAADALGVSASTVRRRIKAQRLESRSNEHGVTEVLIDTHGDDAADSLNPGLELSARRRSDNSDDQLRANPWIRASRPGDALLADRRHDEQAASAEPPPNPTAPTSPTDQPTPTASHPDAEDQHVDKHADTAASPAAPAGSGDERSAEADAAFERLQSAGRDFKPSDLESAAHGGDEAARFQKIAGAAVLLAQRQADDAREQVALARNEAYRLRRLCYTSWTVTAAAAVLCFGLTLSLGYTASSAAARADVAEHLANRHAQAATAQARLALPSRTPGAVAADPMAADAQPPANRGLGARTTADIRDAPFEP